MGSEAGTERVNEVARQLEAMSRELGPDARLPGVRDLCAKFGASTSTLHRAMEMLEARQVIYRRQGSGIYASPRRDQRRVAVVFDYAHLGFVSHSPFYDILAEGSRERAAQGREQFELHSASALDQQEPVPPSLQTRLATGQVQGVLGMALHEDSARWLRGQSVPFVSLGSLGHATVQTDYEAVARLGVRALAEQGCARIALWHSVVPLVPQNSYESSHNFRPSYFDAFEQEVRACGLEHRPELVEDNHHLLSGPYGITRQTAPEQGYRTAQKVFGEARGPKPDGIVSLDDMLTQGALVALGNLNVEAGRDVHIASYANRGSSVLLGHEARLTLLEINPVELIETMFSLLETLMDGGTVSPTLHTVAPQLRAPKL